MDFIEAEEFLKQDEIVQKVFLGWWKPSFGDLISTKVIYDEIDVIIDTTENAIWGMNINFYDTDERYISKALKVIPLFTEGQLRKFIEDKIGCKVNLVQSLSLPVEVWLFNKDRTIKRISSIDKFDVLQTYWKIALKVAKEEIKNV
jgi:hypothetical protein